MVLKSNQRPLNVDKPGRWTMQEAENTKIVQDAYAAFGRGDTQTLLS
jgi:hypothetical protein